MDCFHTSTDLNILLIASCFYEFPIVHFNFAVLKNRLLQAFVANREIQTWNPKWRSDAEDLVLSHHLIGSSSDCGDDNLQVFTQRKMHA